MQRRAMECNVFAGLQSFKLPNLTQFIFSRVFFCGSRWRYQASLRPLDATYDLSMQAAITRELVLKKLGDVFADPAEAAAALTALDNCCRNGAEHLTDLVQLSILKLCEGELWRLRDQVQTAKKDPRDVMYPATSPELTARLRRKPFADLAEVESVEIKSIRRRDTEQWNAWLGAQG